MYSIGYNQDYSSTSKSFVLITADVIVLSYKGISAHVSDK